MDKINEALGGIENEIVRAYLGLMENTETPPLFHVWSLLSAAAACMTRRCWFMAGEIRVMPNQFIMLVGAPGVRKSTAVNYARKLVTDIEGIRFAPNSTGGHLQGFVSAMNEQKEHEDEEDKAVSDALLEMGKFNLGAISPDLEDALTPTHVMNRSALYVAEGELTGFLGKKQDTFINFLGDMWDKSDAMSHIYQIKREKLEVKLPCVNMIGGITPVHITSYLPVEAIGQGFTSRIILVYSALRKKIPWPEPLDAATLVKMKKIMRWIFESKEGPFEVGPGVKDRIISLYSYRVKIEDARFIHYMERRQSHLLKAAMALCALRMDNTVTVADIDDAHLLLSLTELSMTEALGEYGLTPMALARTRIGDLLRRSEEPMTLQRVLMACGSDLSRSDITRALVEMTMAEQIVEVTLRDGNGAQTTGFAWPMERNPFTKGMTVQVDYLVKEQVGGISKSENRTTLENGLDVQRTGGFKPPQASPARATGMSLSPELEKRLSGMSDSAPDTGLNGSLAEQGFATVQDKLNAVIAKQRRLH